MSTDPDLRRSRRDLDGLAAAAVHDLKEPLQVIRMFSTLIERTDPASAEHARVIRRSVERMGRMLDGLVAVTRVQGDPSGVSGLQEAAAAVQVDLQDRIREDRAEVQVDGDAEVSMSCSHLRSVLRALVSNGLQHARPGVPPSVHITVDPAPVGVEVRVTDNGRGIPPDQRERVFALYTRLDPDADGAGVGLALVRRIVNEYGGEARIDEGPGGGTCVKLALPGRALPAP